jgi:hypothetical protein
LTFSGVIPGILELGSDNEVQRDSRVEKGDKEKYLGEVFKLESQIVQLALWISGV